jgi:hypothetical protein
VRRPGFALAAVLAALVLMAMLVAVAAQRALVLAREGTLALARSELALVTEESVAQLLARSADSAAVRAAAPGALLDSGTVARAPAQASWRLLAAPGGFSELAITAEVPVRGGVAREARRVLLRLALDSTGEERWRSAGSGWTAKVPAF